MKELHSPYVPRKEQLDIEGKLKTRFNVLVCHRGFGKSVFAVNYLIKKAFECDLPLGKFFFISPTQKQGKDSIWPMMKYYLSHIPEEYIYFNDTELRIVLPNKHHTEIVLRGADDDGDALRGNHINGLVCDEFASMDPNVWSAVLMPALEQKKGWAIFIGTPAGRNQFYDLYQNGISNDDLIREYWDSFMYRVTDTTVLEERQVEMMKRTMGKDLFDQEMMCSFTAAIKGAYYAEEIQSLQQDKQIGDFAWDQRYKVYTAWDIGFNDLSSIWFCQIIDNKYRIIDFFQYKGKPMDYYIKEVIQSKPYQYDKHFLPHDSIARTMGTTLTPFEQLERVYPGKCMVIEKSNPQVGTMIVKALLPKCQFNASRCQEGLNDLIHYSSDYNPKLGILQQKPKHNKHSHAADAFRYLAYGLPDINSKSGRITTVNNQYDSFEQPKIDGYDPFRYEDDEEKNDTRYVPAF